MNSNASSLWVAIQDRQVVVKIRGRADCHSSMEFKTLILGLIEKGYGCFRLDLSECLMMDSTFLGVLAGTGMRVHQKQSNGSPYRVTLLNPNDHIDDLLDSLGMEEVFEVAHNHQRPEETTFQSVPSNEEKSRRALCETALEAHEALMAINPQNIARFKSVTEFLKADLQKLRQVEGM